MPELPDITVYIDALESRIAGARLEAVRLASPFLLRSVEPPLSDLYGLEVRELRRLGKRIAIGLERELWLVLHLMIAGRLHWHGNRAKLQRRRGLAAFGFSSGTLSLTEAGTKKRASLYVVQGAAALARHDPGGLEVAGATREAFRVRLTSVNHTLKRALADQRLFSGIGNAYSDEILHRARLSPFALSQHLSGEETGRLYDGVRATLADWVVHLRAEAAGRFPEKVTAFRTGMAVHGRYGQPCPVCGTAVQRIRYASNETNYCPRCQTGGKVYADRALSRLLKDDWPRNIDELERLRPDGD